MSKRINIRPTSGVYATYKRLSYQPWTAIAEFVDNSTQSFYDHQKELMDQKYFKGLTITINYIEDKAEGDRIIISDDAYGMEWNDFQRAIILDKPPKNTNGRNEFGMGLKTAACWFGSLWSVESTQLGSKNKYYAEIDVDEVGKYKTEEIDVREEIVSPKDHGTTIIIRRLNKKIKGSRTIAKVKELLSSIYRVDLRSDMVKIYYNDTLLKFKEAPVYIEEVNDIKKEWKKNINFSITHEDKVLTVTGFIAIRIPGSVKDAGFTLLRRGRVIIGGSENNYRPSELFGDTNSFAWQRLYGELHMDNWPVTQAKDSFDWHNSGLEEAFINELKTLTQEYRKKADSIRVREKVNLQDLAKDAFIPLSSSKLFEGGVVEVINDSNTPNDIKQESENTVTDEEPEKIAELPEEFGSNDVINDKNDGVVIEGGKIIRWKFSYKETSYLFNITLDVCQPNIPWLLVEQLNGSEYNLTINMRHPFFKPLIDKKEFLPIMVRMSIALVMSEIELSFKGRIDPSEIRTKMNEILESVGRGERLNG